MSEAADVTLVIGDLGPGGAQRVVSLLASAWAERGRRVTVATFDDGSRDHFLLPDAVRRVVIGGVGESTSLLQGLLANAERVRRLRQELRRSGAPVVVSFIGVTNILAVLASVAAPWQLVISERNDPARQRLGRPWDRLRRLLYRHADVVTANSRGAIDTLSAYVPERKLRLVRNPLDIAHFAPAAAVRRPLILAVGRLAEQKAFDVLIDAFAKIAPNHPDWRLRIAGEGPLRGKLQARAASRGISHRVEFIGAVPDCASHYRAAAVFAMPSRFEGVPNALLEAMASGCACVVSDASRGPLEYVQDDATGLVAPVEDVAALAAALDRLARDPVLRQRLGAAAREEVEGNAVAAVVDAWSDLLSLDRLMS